MMKIISYTNIYIYIYIYIYNPLTFNYLPSYLLQKIFRNQRIVVCATVNNMN